ncbi:MAG: hypothetical protein OXR68_07565 [Alphaproteobacteria bacterium]|nr:hypothetical protein [Alphaproteobacteria bacterium]MDD9920461.1 hypothetical protein [Alphaproteobacteria bacterium]
MSFQNSRTNNVPLSQEVASNYNQHLTCALVVVFFTVIGAFSLWYFEGWSKHCAFGLTLVFFYLFMSSCLQYDWGENIEEMPAERFMPYDIGKMELWTTRDEGKKSIVSWRSFVMFCLSLYVLFIGLSGLLGSIVTQAIANTVTTIATTVVEIPSISFWDWAVDLLVPIAFIVIGVISGLIGWHKRESLSASMQLVLALVSAACVGMLVSFFMLYGWGFSLPVAVAVGSTIPTAVFVVGLLDEIKEAFQSLFKFAKSKIGLYSLAALGVFAALAVLWMLLDAKPPSFQLLAKIILWGEYLLPFIIIPLTVVMVVWTAVRSIVLGYLCDRYQGRYELVQWGMMGLLAIIFVAIVLWFLGMNPFGWVDLSVLSSQGVGQPTNYQQLEQMDTLVNKGVVPKESPSLFEQMWQLPNMPEWMPSAVDIVWVLVLTVVLVLAVRFARSFSRARKAKKQAKVVAEQKPAKEKSSSWFLSKVQRSMVNSVTITEAIIAAVMFSVFVLVAVCIGTKGDMPKLGLLVGLVACYFSISFLSKETLWKHNTVGQSLAILLVLAGTTVPCMILGLFWMSFVSKELLIMAILIACFAAVVVWLLLTVKIGKQKFDKEIYLGN